MAPHSAVFTLDSEYEQFRVNYDKFYRGYTPKEPQLRGISNKFFNGIADSKNPNIKRDIYTYDPIRGGPSLKYRTQYFKQSDSDKGSQ